MARHQRGTPHDDREAGIREGGGVDQPSEQPGSPPSSPGGAPFEGDVGYDPGAGNPDEGDLTEDDDELGPDGFEDEEGGTRRTNTKADLLDSLTKEELKQLAETNGVEYDSGAKKEELVETLANSRKVTKTQITSYVEARDAGGVGENTPAADFTANAGHQVVDRDVRDIPVVHTKGETMAPLNGESWVVLGEHPDVPERYVGAIAAVIYAPVHREYDEATGTTTESLHPDAVITVRERGQGARFTLPLSAFRQISRAGRTEVLTHP